MLARLFASASSQYLSGNTPVTGAPFSMSAWYYPTNLTEDDVIISMHDGTNGEIFMLFSRGTQAGDPLAVAVRGGGSGWAIFNTTLTVSADTWYHAMYVERSSTDRTVYINGGNSVDNFADRTPVGISTVSIGSDIFGPRHFSGRIFLPAIWKVALSDAEVLALAMGKYPWEIRPQNLVGLWLPGLQSDLDYSGNGYHMTAYNSPTWALGPPQFDKPELDYIILRGPKAKHKKVFSFPGWRNV
jgi:hypothetical protein